MVFRVFVLVVGRSVAQELDDGRLQCASQCGKRSGRVEVVSCVVE